MSVQRTANNLIDRAWIETHRFCRADGEPLDGANSKPYRKPGGLINSLSEQQREDVKKIKAFHLNGEIDFPKKKRAGRWGLNANNKNKTRI